MSGDAAVDVGVGHLCQVCGGSGWDLNGAHACQHCHHGATLELGSVCWEAQPAEADYGVRGGTVVQVDADGLEGNCTVRVVSPQRRESGLVIRVHALPASGLNPDLTQPPSPPRMHTLARAICASLGRGRGQWSEQNVWLLDRALWLAGQR